MLCKIKCKLKHRVNQLCRLWIDRRNKKRLKQSHFSVISSNCNGGAILHDLGQPFNSPFVNLYLTPQDFIRYLRNPDYYHTLELVFLQGTGKNYPLAMLGDLTLHFMHYASAEEAENKWKIRLKRLNRNYLFIMMTDRDGCTYQDLQAFDQLPYPNKIVFTHKPYPEIGSAKYIQGFEDKGQVGDLLSFSGWFGKKYYDQFDYVEWFNLGSKK